MVIERQTNSFHFFAKVARFDTKRLLDYFDRVI